MALLVNIYGPPGAGKSTTRAGVFQHLKLSGVNCEEVYEHAKKLTWAQRFGELSCQPYLFGKQMRDIEMLMDQVDVVITDSPLLLSRFYGMKYPNPRLHPSFIEFVTNQSTAMGGLNYLIERVKAYNPSGRNQTKEESDQIGVELRQMLDDCGLDYTVVRGDSFAPSVIAYDILGRLGVDRNKAA